MHRIGGREAEHPAAGPAERLKNVLDDLVRPVRGPDLAGTEPVTEVTGERLAQLEELAVGIASTARASDSTMSRATASGIGCVFSLTFSA
jgi:hypothetical protein